MHHGKKIFLGSLALSLAMASLSLANNLTEEPETHISGIATASQPDTKSPDRDESALTETPETTLKLTLATPLPSVEKALAPETAPEPDGEEPEAGENIDPQAAPDPGATDENAAPLDSTLGPTLGPTLDQATPGQTLPNDVPDVLPDENRQSTAPIPDRLSPDTLTPNNPSAVEPGPADLAASEAEIREREFALAIEAETDRDFIRGAGFERKDREAIIRFYMERDYASLWFKEGLPTEDAKALIARIEKAGDDGLDAADYKIDLPPADAGLERVAEAELRLSVTLLRYARHAQAGRALPAKISENIKLKPVYPDPQSVLVKLATSDDKVAALSSYNPPQKAYRALRAELIRLRASPVDAKKIFIPEDDTLAEGMRGESILRLRERLNVPVLADEEANLFDETVKSAVRAFQAENHLIADGIAGPRTLAAMNGDNKSRIPDIIANMEMWRWVSRDMGELHVQANIPSFDITVVKNEEEIHRTRVVVGTTVNQTPVFSDEMEYVVVNPYWNVPYSIASKELLPIIRSNPGYVENKNYEVVAGNRVINPTSVKWGDDSFKSLRIRQRPGSGNALGDVKFLFPNQYSIYFHDTPSKSLFQKAARAFSHGCVRVHNPFEFGNVLMQNAKGWRPGRLQEMVGGEERWIKLQDDEKIEVHLTYFTAIPERDGSIAFKGDVYGHYAQLKRELGLI
ncbi:MAG: L,D-transpeptidase family protein [Rhizobiales bacterium]|nr:L,D-transpeptidase family protein [Hyphomicrobiales bacterium]